MYHSREQFIGEIIKIAQDTSVGDTEDQGTSGQQSDETPELLQPDEGKGEGSRGEHESFSTGVEKAHTENREGGYLPKAFDGFGAAARQQGAELSNLLDNFGPKAGTSTAVSDAGKSKIGEARLNAFSDELSKIAVGNTARGQKVLRALATRLAQKKKDIGAAALSGKMGMREGLKGQAKASKSLARAFARMH
jgi:hypothetical protein